MLACREGDRIKWLWNRLASDQFEGGILKADLPARSLCFPSSATAQYHLLEARRLEADRSVAESPTLSGSAAGIRFVIPECLWEGNSTGRGES